MKISPLLLSFSLAAGLPLLASNAQADGNQVACDNDKQYLTAGEGRARCPDKAAAAETLSCRK